AGPREARRDRDRGWALSRLSVSGRRADTRQLGRARGRGRRRGAARAREQDVAEGRPRGVKSSTPLPIEASVGGEKSKQKTELLLLRRHSNAAITRVLFALTNSTEISGLTGVKSGSIVAFGGESVLLPIGPPLDGKRNRQG